MDIIFLAPILDFSSKSNFKDFTLVYSCSLKVMTLFTHVRKLQLKHARTAGTKHRPLISFFGGQRPLVPLLLHGPPCFPISLFSSATLLTGMTSNSFHMQWPLTSQSHSSFLKESDCVFRYGSNSMPYIDPFFVSQGPPRRATSTGPTTAPTPSWPP
jgi:hypothetical protein